jgi:hypothetical protein
MSRSGGQDSRRQPPDDRDAWAAAQGRPPEVSPEAPSSWYENGLTIASVPTELERLFAPIRVDEAKHDVTNARSRTGASR